MKKVLSFVMAILCMLPCSGAKAVKTENLSDGEKVLTYKYDELNELIKKYQTAYTQRKAKEKSRRKMKSTIQLDGGLALIVVGSVLIDSGIESLKKDAKTSAKEGTKKCVLGAVGCLGGIGLCCLSMQNKCDSCQLKNMERAINRINTHKVKQYETATENVRENFYLKLFVDKNGFVYKEQYADYYPGLEKWGPITYNLPNGRTHTLAPCNFCYKFPE